MRQMSEEKNKKPDQYAENKAIMPYGDHVGAPSIVPTDLTAYKDLLDSHSKSLTW